MDIKFNSVRFKTAGMVLFLLTVTALAFYIISLSIMNRYLLNEVLKRSEALSKSIAASAGYSLLSKDVLSLDNMVFKVQESNPDVESVAIIDPDGKIIAHSDLSRTGQVRALPKDRILQKVRPGARISRSKTRSAEYFEITTPISLFDKRLGTVILRVNKSELITARQAAQKRTLLFFTVILVLGGAGSIALSSLLTRPIQELSRGVDALKEEKQLRKLRIYSQDEFGKLTASFNEMTTLIDVQKGKLNLYAKELESSYVSTVRVLAAAIDARDPYTHGHSARVSVLAVQCGKEIGLDDKSLEELEVACLFHDIGKIKTPDSILRKRSKLTVQQHKEMMRHCEYGAEILSKAPSLQKYIAPVRHHHEWFNGRGYPDGLTGDAIPLFASIIAITDAYDAMTTNRPYRGAVSVMKTLEEIIRCAGSQFHPELVEVFTRIMDRQIIHELQETG